MKEATMMIEGQVSGSEQESGIEGEQVGQISATGGGVKSSEQLRESLGCPNCAWAAKSSSGIVLPCPRERVSTLWQA